MKRLDILKVLGLAVVSAFSVVGFAFQTGNSGGKLGLDLSRDGLVRGYAVYEEPNAVTARTTLESKEFTLVGWEYTLRIRPPKCSSF